MSIIRYLCIVILLCYIGVVHADEGKDESGKGRGKDYYSEDKEWKDDDDGKRERYWDDGDDDRG